MAIRKFLRCRTNEMLKLWGASSNEEMGWMNQWTNESTNQKMNQWVNEPLSEWINESVWMSEWVSRRTNESANQWTNESLIKIPLTCSLGCFTKHFFGENWLSNGPPSANIQTASGNPLWNDLSVISMKCFSADDACAKTRSATSGNNPAILYKMLHQSRFCPMTEPMNLWIHESMIQWINEPMKEGMGGWMNGWMGELLFRCWDTSSLTDLFAQTPLLSATSSLSSHLFGLLALSCLPASCSFCNQSLLFVQLLQCVLQPPAAIPHSTRAALWSGAAFRAAVTMRLATSSCNPSCQRSVATTLILCQCVVSQPIVNPQSRSGAQNRATFAATSTVRTFRLFRSLF